MKKKIKSFDNKTVLTIGRIGSVLSVLMYVSYIPQITNNLAGNKGSFIQPLVAMINCIVWFVYGNYGNPIQPLVAAINCLIWVLYALLREKKDWPLFVANFPGILFGLTTFITSLH